VVEGTGDHCCEYMTGGVVVVLGQTGRNFAAGMSGGIAYVLDEDGTFEQRCNRAMVELQEMPEWVEGEMHGDLSDMTQYDCERLHMLVSNHARYTGSRRAAEILSNWREFLPKFRKVMPLEFSRALAEMDKARAMQAAE
jgi:glutamate synthase (NADPH/NADH) large chain